MSLSYRKYLSTSKWKAKATECKNLTNNKCNRCSSTDNLHTP